MKNSKTLNGLRIDAPFPVERVAMWREAFVQVNIAAFAQLDKDIKDMFKKLPTDELKEDKEWGENSRGVSVTFGTKVVDDFCDKHDIDLICRAHEVVESGYEFFANKKMVTIFSAPNYSGSWDNAGAVLSIDENLKCSFAVMPSEIKRL